MPKPGDVSARARRRARNRLRLGDGVTLVLLALVLFPFAWLVQMSFDRTPTFWLRARLHAHLGALPGAMDRRFPRLLRQPVW